MKLPKLKGAPEDYIKNFCMPVFWGAKDSDKTALLIRELVDGLEPGVFFSDNIITWCRNNSMLDDEAFVRSWKENAGEDMSDQAIIYRRYVLATSGFHCVQLEGDFVECGCYRGTGVKTVVDYLGGKEFPRTFWAYDLFTHSEDDPHHAMPEHGIDLFERVKQRFEGYSQVNVIKGRIPEVFEGNSPEKISYLHIDLNQAPAEMAALEALFERIVPGGMVILDDYEWSYYRAQKIAQDPWFDSRGYRVIPLPTGQGLVIKH